MDLIHILLCGLAALMAAAHPARTVTAAATGASIRQNAIMYHSFAARFNRYFVIHVVDRQTGRGIPLVRLQTVNGIRMDTDSNGIAAFLEPGLMHRRVFFFVESPGYRYPKDGFGYRGVALHIHPGGQAVLKMKRTDLARRLYRITGEGIYCDSILTGEPVPLQHPLLDGQVLGSDSVMNALYRGRIYWFWGDTLEPQYPLGNFLVTGATSLLPGQGGLNPQVGVNLHYFCDNQGHPQAMAPIPGPGTTWISGLTVLTERGRQSLYATYGKYRPPAIFHAYRRGLLKYDHHTNQFRVITDFPSDWPLLQDGSPPCGHTFIMRQDGRRWIYFANPLPLIRVPAHDQALANPSDYQAFTCLEASSDATHPRFDHSPGGALQWRWRSNTSPCQPETYAAWRRRGLVKPAEYIAPMRDIRTGKPVILHAGSVHWNAYLKRWLLVAESAPFSMGDIYVAAGDTPLGPWGYARRVVHFPRMSFYNPNEDWFFDRHDGRAVFFEATYSKMFSASHVPTPRYDYNQLMYELELNDPHLLLPVAFYGDGPMTSAMRLRSAERLKTARRGRRIAFFALAKFHPGTVPIYVRPFSKGISRLSFQAARAGDIPLFYAFPANAAHPPQAMVELEELRTPNGRYLYAAGSAPHGSGNPPQARPLCLVWPSEWKALLPFVVGRPSENH